MIEIWLIIYPTENPFEYSMLINIVSIFSILNAQLNSLFLKLFEPLWINNVLKKFEK